jgi:hypothetical protein
MDKNNVLNNLDNSVDNNTEYKRVNINKIRNEANEISKIINKNNFDVNKLKIQYNSFFLAYPTLFNNLVDKKLSLEELNIILTTLDNAQDHFFKSI